MRDSAREDLGLVQRCLSGDVEAFSEVVRRYQRPVFGLIMRMLSDQGRAEEITQDVFVRSYTKLASFDQQRKFSSWLFRIAHNAAIDELRKRRVHLLPLETKDDDDGVDLLQVLSDRKQVSPERRATGSALREDIEEVIEQLRPDYAEVMVLRFVEDFSYEEISEVMGIPLGTVKTYIHRARQQTAKKIAARGWGPDMGSEKDQK